jgi:hypothetical protein
MDTPYSQALEAAQKERVIIEDILGRIDSRSLAYSVVRALEQKFGFWVIISSTEDLQNYMENSLGVQWFINRGYTKPDGSELEEVPEITQELIDELAMDMHPWREIEEDVWGYIQAYFKETIESMFPEKEISSNQNIEL